MAARRRIVPVVVALLIVGLFGSTMWFLWSRSRPRPVAVETGKPVVTDIVKKTVAAGTIQPRKEIEIKPRVSGILRKLLVEAGQRVRKGDLIGEVEIIPDVVNLNDAELRLRSSKLNEERTKRELDRAQALTKSGAGTATELDRLRSDFEMATQETVGAEMRVRLLRSGAASRGKGASTRVESTVDGTVLAVLVREGASVINANSFNPGTTIVAVADMTDLVFKGRIDESEVGKVKENMPVEIVVGALAERKFDGKLERIAPKSLAKDGITEFEIEIAFHPPSDVLVRAGYSANANIVLDRRTKVLAIDEAFVKFDKDRRTVEVQTGGGAPSTAGAVPRANASGGAAEAAAGGGGTWTTREVKLGLSDGIRVEVLSGVKEGDVLKKPAPPSGS